MIYYTLCIHYVIYSSHIHHSINNFKRNKSIRMFTILLIPLDSKLHQVVTNLGEKKADEEKRYFDIVNVTEDEKIDDLSDAQKST